MKLIKNNGGKLSTGFLGVKPLLPALSETGHSDEAYKLLLSTTYPSWGCEVINGANTIWERWNSYIKGKGFENNAGMNSFNHYAFGSVNESLFSDAAGIKVGQPGYKTFTIKPEIAKEGINFVNAKYHSINGEIVSSWKKVGNKLIVHFEIPVNTTADVFVPTSNQNKVIESGTNVIQNPDYSIKGYKNVYLNMELGSGVYTFDVE